MSFQEFELKEPYSPLRYAIKIGDKNLAADKSAWVFKGGIFEYGVCTKTLCPDLYFDPKLNARTAIGVSKGPCVKNYFHTGPVHAWIQIVMSEGSKFDNIFFIFFFLDEGREDLKTSTIGLTAKWSFAGVLIMVQH